MVFAIHWRESAMDLHVFPIPIPPPTSLPTHPSGSSQCTSPEHVSHASNLGWWSVSKIHLTKRFNGEGNGNPLQYSCLENPMDRGAWLIQSWTRLRLHFHFSFSCIGEGKATHSSVLAWRIPGTGKPGGLPSMGSHRVRHDWSNLAAAVANVSNRFPR